ncbi:Hypothetical protein POVN_LOCUS323 [uncultured virus]|nr:Hypothetical protein POVN_LOCUS323 [uncultured virus]
MGQSLASGSDDFCNAADYTLFHKVTPSYKGDELGAAYKKLHGTHPYLQFIDYDTINASAGAGETKGETKGEAPTTVVFFHGNGCDLGHVAAELKKWHQLTGYTVVAFEYPGYGQFTSKTATEKHFCEAIDYNMTQLVGWSLPQTQFVLVGHSLGCAAALYAATKTKIGPQVKAVVLAAPFTNLPAMGAKLTPLTVGSVGLVTTKRLDNLIAIKELQCPFVIMHGDKDEVIPIEQGHELYEASKVAAAKRFVPLTDVGHNMSMDLILEQAIIAQQALAALKEGQVDAAPG